MVDPAGPAARSIASLWWVMLAGGGAIFLLVAVLIILAWRPSRQRAAEADEGEHVWILGFGLAFPVVVLAALLAFGLVVGERLLPRDGAEVVRVEAKARQWAWTFTYADAPALATEDVLHIPAGRPVDVAITTADVIHSFWVPRLAGKLDAIPGHVNVLRIEADAPGRYAGKSAEFSGAGYDGHGFEVIAHDAEAWQAFIGGTR